MLDIEAEFVHVEGLRAYLARPLGGATGGMLLLPMITGIDAQVREYAHDIAASGVTALVWDPWHGPSSDDTPVEELMALMERLDDENCLTEMTTLLDHAFGELELAKVGVIGWCLGGRLALILGARDQRVANVVAYHPSIVVPRPPHHAIDAVESAGRVEAPVMVLHAGADTIMSTDTFGQLQSTLQSRTAGATVTHVYPGADHGFSSRKRQDKQVNADAYALSWPQALRFMGDTVLS